VVSRTTGKGRIAGGLAGLASCAVLAAVILGGLGLVIAGLVIVMGNRCFFLQFPPAGCPVASLDPPGTALGWHLFFGGLIGGALLVSVLGLTAHAVRQPRK
jgi:hypothetical protein